MTRVHECRSDDTGVGPSIASGSQHQLAAKTDLATSTHTNVANAKSRTLANDATDDDDDEFDATGIDATDEQPDESGNDANPGTENELGWWPEIEAQAKRARHQFDSRTARMQRSSQTSACQRDAQSA